MSNGFLQDQTIDYPIYALIRSDAGTTVTLNTGTEDFLFDVPAPHLDWASPDIPVSVSGLGMMSYVGGFTVFAATTDTMSLNIRLGTGQLLDVSEGTIGTTIAGPINVFVSSAPMTARAGDINFDTVNAEVFVSGIEMIANFGVVDAIGIPNTLILVGGLQMTAFVGQAKNFNWGENPDESPDGWAARGNPSLESWASRSRTGTGENWIRKRGHA